jgi:ferrochelatase
VVEIPKFIWWFILNGIIIPFRSKQSATKYASIWTKDGSPLKLHTLNQAALLQGHLHQRGHQVEVIPAMSYGQPGITSVLEKLQHDGAERILILPAYPQYSGTTTASVFDAVFNYFSTVRNIPELRLIKHYHDQDGYIVALAQSIRTHWAQHQRAGHLVMSFHGVPKRTLLLGDPYHCECYKTARLVAQQLGLDASEYTVTFQSRFGKTEWLQPYTLPTLLELAKKPQSRVDVICPGFTSDCLETLEEINIEGRHAFLQAGGKEFYYIPCLNEDPLWISGLAGIVETHIHGWPTGIEQQRQLQTDAFTSATLAMALKNKQDANITSAGMP